MRIYVVNHYSQSIPVSAPGYPCALLVIDQWNDFGYKTQFKLTIFLQPNDPLEIGYVKIFQKGESRTKLPEHFDDLDRTHISVGQSYDFYRAIRGIPRVHGLDLLGTLNDITEAGQFKDDFSDFEGVTKSLLREIEPQNIWNEGVDDSLHPALQEIKTSYRTHLQGTDIQLEIPLHFADKANLPSNINILVGNNRTGKTTILNSLARTVSGSEAAVGNFSPVRPPFSCAIAISYSMFDPFVRPPETAKTRAFKRLGVYGTGASVSDRNALISNVLRFLTTKRMSQDVGTLQRKELLFDVVNRSLGNEIESKMRKIITPTDASNQKNDLFSSLSSGQVVVLSLLTELVESIEPFSLVLIDEPEMHLHPSGIAGLMHSIYEILCASTSFAIFATHSPLVLQQVPSRYITCLHNVDDSIVTSRPSIETFGANLTEIADEVFQAYKDKSLFRTWLDEGQMTQEKCDGLFDLTLSAHAHIGKIIEND